MIINREEKERVWKEMVDRSNERISKVKIEKINRDWKKRGRFDVNKKELVSDLKGFVILLVFWVLFGLFMEFV